MDAAALFGKEDLRLQTLDRPQPSPGEIVVALDTDRLHYRDITLRASIHHTPATCRTAVNLMASGGFRSAEFITTQAPLSQVPEVFRQMLSRSSGTGARDVKTAIYPEQAG